MRDILFMAKRSDNGEWVVGLPSYDINGNLGEIEVCKGFCNCDIFEIDPKTIRQYTGLTDKNDRKIFEGDVVRLILPSGEIRYFKVSIKSVVRRVLSHPDFDDEFSKVEITGVVFEWQGYELFPCVDEQGVPDNKRMVIVGNIYDNPELLEAGQQANADVLMPAT